MSCPECGGQQMVGHPAGLLALQHILGCSLYAREDATRANDNDLDTLGRRHRPATDTERLLLDAIGHGPLPSDLTTVITDTGALYSRRWPQLADGT